MDETKSILIVDNDPIVTNLLSIDLRHEGYNCVDATTGEDALKRLSMENFDLVILELKLPGISGMDVLKEAKSNYPETAIIVVTVAGDTQTAVEAMKIGAVDYITKPFELERVNSSIEAALKKMPVCEKTSDLHRDSAKAGSDEVDWTDHLDAIARGVKLKLESITFEAVNMTIIERTTTIARDLEIPNYQIDRWVDARQKQNAECINVMGSLLEKLERNPIAQTLLGMTGLHRCPPGHDSRLN